MEVTKNVGIWIRVSTDFQVDNESPEHHEERARSYAKAKGWNVVTFYRLDALSGKSIILYPETKRMLRDIKGGVISGLIFSKLARFARNTKELLEMAEYFRAANADLISLAESIDTSTPAGRFFFTILAAMGQWEREETAERVAASVPIRARMGKPLGGQATFGYKWEGKELIINETEAPIRKLLYETYLKTKRIKATATTLNGLGHRTRNGSKFTGTTVERLIKDSTAKGIRRANYTKSLGEKKNWIIKPESEWIEIPCPAIVDETIWNECNSILSLQTKKRVNVGPRTVHLLAGYVYCDCGSKMYVYTESPMYKCKKCKRKIAVADIDEIYHEQLKSFLMTEDDIETLASKSNTTIREKETLLKTIQGEYDKLAKRTEQQMNLRLDGELSKEDFAKFYKPVEQQLRQLEHQLPELQAEVDFLKIQYLSSDTIIQEAKDLYTNWWNLPYEEKRSIVETITQRIEIHQDRIDIALAYDPNPSLFQNDGNRARNFRDSSKRST
ncbi:MAG: recombinase family protein [Bacteroidota bacterium]